MLINIKYPKGVEIMKKLLSVLDITVVAISMLFGCGKATTRVEVEEIQIEPPVINALEKYDSVIAGLKAGQYYGFAGVCKEYDILLVTDGVFDMGDGTMAAIDATLYGLDNDGNVIELGNVMSSGTAYPLAVYDDAYLMYGGNHHMYMSYVDGGSIINKKYAEEVFDTEANATYYLLDADKKFEGEVDDDSELVKMYEAYADAVVINFTKSGATEEAVEETAMEAEDLEYVSDDGWKIQYNTGSIFLNDMSEDGEICFNYIGECSGTTAAIISYVPGVMPDEALDNKTAGYADEMIEKSENGFGYGPYWSHTRRINPGNTDPDAGDIMYTSFIGVEHNGGTVVIETISHYESDEGRGYAIDDTMSALLTSFELINHEPQTEYSNVPGTYIHVYEDEIGGDVIKIEDTIVLTDDHRCEVTTQDTITGMWTGTELIMDNGNVYEYTIEGDSLLFNMDGMLITFNKE